MPSSRKQSRTTTEKPLDWASFLSEVKTATRYIERYPEIAPVLDEGVRAKVLVRFPYSLMYVVDEQELFIVAVAHQSKRPAYWLDRIAPLGD